MFPISLHLIGSSTVVLFQQVSVRPAKPLTVHLFLNEIFTFSHAVSLRSIPMHYTQTESLLPSSTYVFRHLCFLSPDPKFTRSQCCVKSGPDLGLLLGGGAPLKAGFH